MTELVYFLRTVTLDSGVCPSLAKDGVPRCALESFCHRIPMSAHLAGVILLIAFLTMRAPGMATYYLCVLFQ